MFHEAVMRKNIGEKRRVVTKSQKPVEPNTDPLPQLTPELLRNIGEALGGRHWQSDIARETDRSKSQITRYLNEERTPDVDFGERLDRVMADKIEDVSRFLGHSGSPNKGHHHFKEALALLKGAVKHLRKISPKVERTTIEETSTRTKPPGKKKAKKSRKITLQ